ncbi:hypothetical protein A3860_21465 [Niastella vici]|uniref:Uncharacterized protein n=1 Tax=Niastella vici TaxID=1703345 RepID=A0A1V9G086_9BACT|nr:hypothetical protein [Niastella vici]OQP63992.1 hypothetical protein A3860_21465 [Niastella vici]
MRSILSTARIGIAAFAGIVIVLSLYAFKTVHTVTDDLWARLGMNKTEGFEGAKNSFMRGYLYYYGAKNIKSIAKGDRVAVAGELLTTVKQYINSDAFKKEYDQERQQAKPHQDATPMRTKEEVRKDEIDKMEKGLKQTEEMIRKTPSLAKSMQGVIDMYKKNIVDYKDPNSKTIELFFQGEKLKYERSTDGYTKDLTKWKESYPADYRELIKTRLQKFLELSATVDFNAELKEVNGKQKFVNPDYEGKPADWKEIFRAGKDITEVSRKFAQQWLAGLGK